MMVKRILTWWSEASKAALVVSIAAMFVSIAALAASMWQGIETRAHNRMSVKPDVYALKILGKEDGTQGIQIINSGLGPAKISALVLYLNSKKISSPDYIGSRVKEIVGENEMVVWLKKANDLRLSEGESIDLFKVGISADENTRNSIRALLNDIELQIDYCSMYEECFSWDSQD